MVDDPERTIALLRDHDQRRLDPKDGVALEIGITGQKQMRD